MMHDMKQINMTNVQYDAKRHAFIVRGIPRHEDGTVPTKIELVTKLGGATLFGERELVDNEFVYSNLTFNSREQRPLKLVVVP